MSSNNKKGKTDNKSKPAEAEEAVARGKKAIAANQQANGKDPRNQATVSKENKDAEHWRNEG